MRRQILPSVELDREPCPSVLEVPLALWEWDVLCAWLSLDQRACARLSAARPNGLTQAVRDACYHADPIAARLLAREPGLTLAQAFIRCTRPPTAVES